MSALNKLFPDVSQENLIHVDIRGKKELEELYGEGGIYEIANRTYGYMRGVMNSSNIAHRIPRKDTLNVSEARLPNRYGYMPNKKLDQQESKYLSKKIHNEVRRIISRNAYNESDRIFLHPQFEMRKDSLYLVNLPRWMDVNFELYNWWAGVKSQKIAKYIAYLGFLVFKGVLTSQKAGAVWDSVIAGVEKIDEALLRRELLFYNDKLFRSSEEKEHEDTYIMQFNSAKKRLKKDLDQYLDNTWILEHMINEGMDFNGAPFQQSLQNQKSSRRSMRKDTQIVQNIQEKMPKLDWM